MNSQGCTIDEMATKIYICDFEVFGIVQGVFFRKHTEKIAKSLQLRGWCMNTIDGTVKGQIEGEMDKIKEMQHWLQTVGSPQRGIDKAVFSDIKEIPAIKYKNFGIRY